ncbi:hypothetical protein [Variovorax saccharolyticus]|uniref:hypothetical protein n=1 Tax=Variovorax saccharolyticus TaxID=3053516 RepID=UPI00257657A7|nr:hypothetical protein [Variovorax sp. J31P216]MDM0030464.1 hypothetical protein [Variovorax sp. J31P216]
MTSIYENPKHVLRRVDDDGGKLHSSNYAKIIEYYVSEGVWSADISKALLVYPGDGGGIAMDLDSSENSDGKWKYTVLMPDDKSD